MLINLIHYTHLIDENLSDQFMVYGGAAYADPQYGSAHKEFRNEYSQLLDDNPRTIIDILPGHSKMSDVQIPPL